MAKKIKSFKPFALQSTKPLIKRVSSTKRGYDTKWYRTQRAYLAAHPLCQEPGCRDFATQVDHRRPMSQGGLKHDWSNLCGYCARHHAQKSVREDGGFGRKRRRYN